MNFHDSLDKASTDHGWSKATRCRYQTSLIQIGRILDDVFADKGIDLEDIAAWEITVAEVEAFVALRKGAGTSIATINRDLTAFAHLMTAMKNKGRVENNPVRLFERQGMREGQPDIVMPTNDGIRTSAERAPGTLSFFPLFLDATGAG